MKTVYFVRHGESQSNIEGFYAGSRYDVPLTSKGLEQADRTAAQLKGKVPDLIVASPLLRAKTTAEHIAKKLGYKKEIVLEPLLKERDFGDASGEKWGSAIEEQIENGTVKDLETVEQLAERMQRLLDWFRDAPGETILAVGHGTAERMLQTVYLGKPAAAFLETRELDNTEIREYLLD